MIRKCPHHEVPKWQLVQIFYDCLPLSQRQIMIDASYGASLMNTKTEDQA